VQSKSILLFLARAGLLEYNSFFLLIIGFKELEYITLGFRTYMRISFLQLKEF
jgi:hypothetical protein